jgi:hypothetical protein
MGVEKSKGALKFKSCNFARKTACKMHEFKIEMREEAPQRD